MLYFHNIWKLSLLIYSDPVCGKYYFKPKCTKQSEKLCQQDVSYGYLLDFEFFIILSAPQPPRNFNQLKRDRDQREQRNQKEENDVEEVVLVEGDVGQGAAQVLRPFVPHDVLHPQDRRVQRARRWA
jgi:hypothetical protein